MTFKKQLCCSLMLGMMSVASLYASENYENELLNITTKIEQGKLDQALTLLEQFLQENPKSRIGYLLKADIYKAKSGELNGFAEGLNGDELSRKNFQHELNNRSAWQQKIQTEDFHNKIPASIVDMGTDQYVLVAEMETGRFFLFGNRQGQPYLVKDYYMSIGKAGYGKQVEGDNKTPLGVYTVTHEIDGAELPDLYGSGAFPVDYPNVVDRWRKRTGYGIWLHGTPSDTYNRAPLSSEGCFVLSNADYDQIAPYIREAKNPKVLLLEKINWLTVEQHQQHRQNYLQTLRSWVAGWESLDINRYLSFYDSEEFNFGKTNFTAWSERKKLITKNKQFVQVSLEIDGIYLYPGEKDMFTVNMRQHYLSNNFKGSSDKTMFWRKSAQGQWKIVYEGKQV